MSKHTQDSTLHGDLAGHCMRLESERDELKEANRELLEILSRFVSPYSGLSDGAVNQLVIDARAALAKHSKGE